jgi:hypothetical protein
MQLTRLHTLFLFIPIMKATIKIVSAGKFTEDQERIIKRIAFVLAEHDLSVKIERKIKKVQTYKLKAV